MGKLEEKLKETEEAAKLAAEKKRAEEAPPVEKKEPEEKPEGKEAEESKETPEEIDLSKLSDEQIFKILTDKVGREVKSYDDLTKIEQKEVEKEVRKYDSPESEEYDKYYKETGRPMSDFINLRKDWTKEADEGTVMEYLKQNNPYLSSDDIRFKLDNIYKIPEKLDSEDYSAEEIATRNNMIRMREIEWKELVAKSRKFLDENKQKYQTPLEQRMQTMQDMAEQGKQFWEEGMTNAIPEKLMFGEFEYPVKNQEGYKESFSSLDNLINKFKGENGMLDHGKLAKTIIAGEQVLGDDFLKAYGKHVEAHTIETQMAKKSNVTGEEAKETPKDNPTIEEAKQKFLEGIKANGFGLIRH